MIIFAPDFRAIELVDGINNFVKKGVIEILSSIIELGGLNFHEDKVGNSTYIDGLYTVVTDSLYSSIGVGLLFYPWNRYAKT